MSQQLLKNMTIYRDIELLHIIHIELVDSSFDLKLADRNISVLKEEEYSEPNYDENEFDEPDQ